MCTNPENDEVFQYIFSNATTGMIIIDADAKIYKVNKMICTILGYKELEVGGQRLDQLICSDVYNELKEKIDSHFNNDLCQFYLVSKMQKKNGEKIIVNIKCLKVTTENCERISYVIYIKDSTLRNSMEEAKKVQERLMATILPINNRLGVYAKYVPAENVGGDFYALYDLKDSTLMVIADICGNGFSAAMVSVYLKTKLDSIVNDIKETNVGKILNFIKKSVLEENIIENKFLTVFICMIKNDDTVMKFCNAGHCKPLIMRDGELMELEPVQYPIAIVNKEDYTENRMDMHVGDKVLLYTDGLVEWRRKNKFFGYINFRKYFSEAGITKKSVNQLINEGIKSGELRDDSTVLVFSIGNKIIREIASDKENLRKAMDWFAKEIEDKMFFGKYNARIMQCLDELTVNAFKHGNKFDKNKKVRIVFEKSENFVKLTVSDEGDGFDWNYVLNESSYIYANTPQKGLNLVKYFSDEITYNNLGNLVTVKIITGGGCLYGTENRN